MERNREQTDDVGKEGLLHAKETTEKNELLEIIEACNDMYFIKSVLTYARCLRRALAKK